MPDSSQAQLSSPPVPYSRAIRALLAVAALCLVLGALKAASSVLLPFVFALFFMALLWPLQKRLTPRMPGALAALISLVALLVIMALFWAGIWGSFHIVEQQWPQYDSRFRDYYEGIRLWVAQVGLFLPEISSNVEGQAREKSEGSGFASQIAIKGIKTTAAAMGAMVLLFAYFFLGLVEIHDFKDKLVSLLPEGSDRGVDVLRRASRDFQKYFGVRTLVGAITGVLVGLSSWAIGLELAFVWGFLNFLLNYIPTLGSIIAIAPPVVFALLQHQDVSQALVALGAVGGVQLLMGSYIDPLLQGHYLKLSALVVLLSVAFWGWLWGIAGAFIGVPIMVFVVLLCNHFPPTRWIAVLLAEKGTMAEANARSKLEPKE